MSARISTILTAFLSCILACDHQTTKPASGPEAVVEPRSVRIESNGEKQAEVVSFRIRNMGDASFDVVDIKASCGCTDVKIDSNKIEPGGESIITASITSIDVGTKHMSIDVITNVPGESRLPIPITLVGTAKVPYVIRNTENIAFGQVVKSGGSLPIFVETHEAAGSDPWIKSLNTVSDKILIEGGLFEESPIDDKVVFRQYRFHATLNSLFPPGEFRTEANFGLSEAIARKPKPIPIHGSVVAFVQASPSAIFGNFRSFDQVPAFVIAFRKLTGKDQLRIDTVSIDSQRYLLEKIPSGNGLETYRVRVRNDFGKELTDELVFRTGVAEMPEIRLPVRLRIRD